MWRVCGALLLDYLLFKYHNCLGFSLMETVFYKPFGNDSGAANECISPGGRGWGCRRWLKVFKEF